MIEHNVIALCDSVHPERPQIYLDLCEHRVKQFVGGDYLLNQYQTDSFKSNLVLLVNCTNEKVQGGDSEHAWLMVINFSRNKVHLLDDAHIYIVEGHVPLPPDYEHARIVRAELLMK